MLSLKPFKLTELQRAYWVGRREEIVFGGVAIHFYYEVDINALDLDRLAFAWDRVVRRHDMLRMVVLSDGTQHVLDAAPDLGIPVLDLTALQPEVVDAQFAVLRRQLSHRCACGDVWPLHDLRITRSEARIRLHLSFDGLATDFHSVDVILEDWCRFYHDLNVALTPPAASFQNFVEALEASRRDKVYRQDLAYWRATLDTLPPAPELPMIRESEVFADTHFARESRELSQEVWERLSLKADEFNIRPVELLFAAYSQVLKIYSKNPSFTVNLSIRHRIAREPRFADLPGAFGSTTLVPIEGSAPGGFLEFAQNVKGRLRTSLRHSSVGGVEVLRELAARNDDASLVQMPVIFTSLVTADHERGSDPFSWLGQTVFAITQTPQVSLDLQAREHEGRLVLNWDHRVSLFPPGLVSDMANILQRFLIELTLGDAPWGDWSGVANDFISGMPTAKSSSDDLTQAAEGPLLHMPFLEQAEHNGARPAVLTPDMELSYSKLLDLSQRISGWLTQQGAGRESLVAVVMHKGWEQIAAVLGIFQAGAAYLPIDADLPAERLLLLLKQGGARLVLTQPQFMEEFLWPGDTEVLSISREGLASIPPLKSLVSGQPKDLAYVIFTSGSTGMPKGVAIEHRAAMNTIAAVNRQFQVGPADRVLALSSLSFDLSVWDIFGVLAAGGAIVLPDAASSRDPRAWLHLVSRFKVTIWNSVPALFQLLVDDALARGVGLPRSLRTVLLSGDWIPLDLPDRARILSNDLEMISLGGATEASIWSIFYPVTQVTSDWSSIPYGRSLDNQTWSVLDSELAPCPVWVTGELYIGGTGLARGYWRDKTRTRESFIEHPQTGERLYKTGDLGRLLPDGNIEILGRRDFQVKIRGFRIELGEIETGLLRHPAVRAAIVVVNGPSQGPRTLVAHIVPNCDPAPAEQDLMDHLRAILPDYMIPSRFEMWSVFPLTSNGKIDRTLLTQATSDQTVASIKAPQSFSGSSHINDRLAAIITEYAGVTVPDEQTSLLTLGVDSIAMMRLVGSIEDHLGIRLSLDSVYREPSLAGLARLCESAGITGGTSDLETSILPPRGARIEVLRDPGERERFKARKPGLRELSNPLEVVELPRPIDEALIVKRSLERRSHRVFDPGSVSLSELGGLLAMLRPCGGPQSDKRIYGSAGGLYPVQIYVYARPGSVDNISGGYYYNSQDHSLEQLTSDLIIPTEAFDPLINRPIFDGSAFALFMIADMRAIEPMYGERSEHYAMIEVGLITQVLEEAAPGLELGLCQIGEFDAASLNELFQLEEGHKPLHCLLGGIVEGMREKTDVDLPLTPAQERVASTVIDGVCPPSWNISAVVHCCGALNAIYLQEIIDKLVHRHDALRAVLGWADGLPVQRILAQIQVQIESNEPPEYFSGDLVERASGIAKDLIRKPFSLEHGPLFRVHLLKMTEGEALLILVLNSFITDCFSLQLLMSEFTPKALEHTYPPKPDSTQYRELVFSWVSPGEKKIQRLMAYWKESLQGAKQLSKQVQGQIDVNSAQGSDSVFPVTFSPEIVTDLREMGTQENATLFVTVLACLVQAVHRIINASDIIIGTTVSCRSLKGAADAIAPLSNYLPLRFNMNEGVEFQDLLKQARGVSISAFAHQEIPYEQIQNILGVDASNPLIELSFILHKGSAGEAFHLPDVGTRPMNLSLDGQLVVPTIFPIECVLVDGPAGLCGEIRCAEGWPQAFGSLLGANLVEVVNNLFNEKGKNRRPYKVSYKTQNKPPSADLNEPKPLRVLPLQQEILDCWREILPPGMVNLNRTFFDSGGDSLAAVSLAARIEEQLGLHVPLEFLFKNPTPLVLIKLVLGRVMSATYGPLTMLKKGINPPIFIVPGRFPSPFKFFLLARDINTEQAVYFTNLAATQAMRDPLCSVDMLATELLDALFNVGYDKSQGPAVLIGNSMGGIVVYEMALQLLKLGYPAPTAILMDADTERSLHDRGLREKKEVVYKQRGKTSDLVKGIQESEVVSRHVELKNLFRVAKKIHVSYRVKPSTLAIALILAKEASHPPSLEQAWRDAALGGVSLYEVPGNKESKLQAPNLDHLTKTLSYLIQEARGYQGR